MALGQNGGESIRPPGTAPRRMKRSNVQGERKGVGCVMVVKLQFHFLKAPSEVALLHVLPCDCANTTKVDESPRPELTTVEILAPLPPGLPKP